MKLSKGFIIRIAIIAALLTFALVFAVTHFPRSMEFSVTVYKLEKNADGWSSPDYDRPFDMVCEFTKWDKWFGVDTFHGTVTLDEKTYTTTEDVRWYHSTPRHGAISIVWRSDNGNNITGSIELDLHDKFLYVYLDETIFTKGTGSQYSPGDTFRYVCPAVQLDPEIAAFLSP